MLTAFISSHKGNRFSHLLPPVSFRTDGWQEEVREEPVRGVRPGKEGG